MIDDIKSFPDWPDIDWLYLGLICFICTVIAGVIYVYMPQDNQSENESEERIPVSTRKSPISKCFCGSENVNIRKCKQCNQTAQSCSDCKKEKETKLMNEVTAMRHDIKRMTQQIEEQNAEQDVEQRTKQNAHTTEISESAVPAHHAVSRKANRSARDPSQHLHEQLYVMQQLNAAMKQNVVLSSQISEHDHFQGKRIETKRAETPQCPPISITIRSTPCDKIQDGKDTESIHCQEESIVVGDKRHRAMLKQYTECQELQQVSCQQIIKEKACHWRHRLRSLEDLGRPVKDSEFERARERFRAMRGASRPDRRPEDYLGVDLDLERAKRRFRKYISYQSYDDELEED